MNVDKDGIFRPFGVLLAVEGRCELDFVEDERRLKHLRSSVKLTRFCDTVNVNGRPNQIKII